MKHKFIQTLLLVLLPTLFAACGSDNNDPTDNIGGLSVSTDLKNNEVSAKGGSFFLQIKAEGKWTASSQDSWCTINNKEGNGKNYRYFFLFQCRQGFIGEYNKSNQQNTGY